MHIFYLYGYSCIGFIFLQKFSQILNFVVQIVLDKRKGSTITLLMLSNNLHMGFMMVNDYKKLKKIEIIGNQCFILFSC